MKIKIFFIALIIMNFINADNNCDSFNKKKNSAFFHIGNSNFKLMTCDNIIDEHNIEHPLLTLALQRKSDNLLLIKLNYLNVNLPTFSGTVLNDNVFGFAKNSSVDIQMRHNTTVTDSDLS